MAAAARLGALRDGWRRLRPPVRWAAGALLILTLASLAVLLLRGQHSSAVNTAGVSVRLAGPPAAATAAKVDAVQLRAQLTDRTPLTAAPRDEFLATAPEGRVPRKGRNGAGVWQAYARPTPALPAGTPQLAILLTEVGLPSRAPQAMLDLPGAVSFAIDNTTPDPAGLIAAARAAGHECALDLPLSPVEGGDLGPEALRWDDPAADNLRKLRVWLARSPGAFALLSHNGAGFAGNRRAMMPLLQDLALRGVGWVAVSSASADSMAIAKTLSLPATEGTIALDEVPNAEAIAAAFQAAVVQAQRHGPQLAVAHAYPVTVQALTELLPTLADAGVALVPVSALLQAGHE